MARLGGLLGFGGLAIATAAIHVIVSNSQFREKEAMRVLADKMPLLEDSTDHWEMPCLSEKQVAEAISGLDLSTSGVLAFRTLGATPVFQMGLVSFDGSLPMATESVRDLLNEPNAGQAFRKLLHLPVSTKPGKLYALCGLYLKDKGNFEAEAEWLRNYGGEVPTQSGCFVTMAPVQDIIGKADETTAPADTLSRSTIASGDLPRMMEDYVNSHRDSKTGQFLRKDGTRIP
ncbi:MAG: hypothetical protein K1X53_03350 [Candidatus Sumerlaeaceae bacterium]|nr:hypothetical protein [Candidatus Sumerlaeaceae bacterium]